MSSGPRSLANHRLATIVGPSGIGKTTVALAVARCSLTLLADGVERTLTRPSGAKKSRYFIPLEWHVVALQLFPET
jgi:predicted ATPase